ncbi:MAG: hypothetical protein R2867_29670 [Caldilineaceae bacterium]
MVDQLLAGAATDDNGYYTWNSSMTTYMGGYGNVSNIETAAMTAIALLRLGQHLDVAQGAIDSLIAQRDPNGMFYSTQTTVLALKALLLAAEEGGAGERRHGDDHAQRRARRRSMLPMRRAMWCNWHALMI